MKKTIIGILCSTMACVVATVACGGEQQQPVTAYSITITDDGNGTAVAEVGDRVVTEAEPNAEVTLSADPAEGYVFDKWTVVGGSVELSDAAANPATFTMPAEDVDIIAEFKPQDITADRYTITLTDDGHGRAEAAANGGKVTASAANVEVTLTAVPDEGYDFDKWTLTGGSVELSDASATPATFTMPAENVEIRAEFKPQDIAVDKYTIILTDDGRGSAEAAVNGGTVTESAANVEVTLTAVPDEGCVFDKWEVLSGGAALSNRLANPATFIMPAEGVEVKATFISLTEPEMIFVEGGTFMMGSDAADARDNERPAHQVTLSDYYIGKYEVTREQWIAVMDNDPSWFHDEDNLPVESVSWNDVQEFIARLNEMTGRTYALPTEAQWEFAARGGNQSHGYTYSGSNDIGSVAWYDGNSSIEGTRPVGTRAPNELGIYDMSGNVEEWCSDWFDFYKADPQTDPAGPSSGSYRIPRGGCWADFAQYSRVVFRYGIWSISKYSDTGFRLVLVR
jgi:formylglycine-generating enzyme required for sulfatase activity